jgi:membrane-bound inhibitor of C-type lysozyme
MRYCIYSALAALCGLTFVQSAAAQTYLQYRCEDGAQISVAFVDNSKAAFVQLDGKAMTLPLRLSAWGLRYKESGVTLWIKGNDTRLKRPKNKWTQCKAV